MVGIFEQWVDLFGVHAGEMLPSLGRCSAKTLMNELQEEHEEWLCMLPRMAVAVARAPEEEMEGEARTNRELAVELRMLKKKVSKLEDQAQIPIPICNYFWAFVGMVMALGVMLKLYGKT